MLKTFQINLFLVSALLLASGVFAQEVTELGQVPQPSAGAAQTPADPAISRTVPSFSTLPSAPVNISPLTGAVLSGEQLFERTIPSIVVIETLRTDGKGMLGSGFFVSEDGLLVTNAHVVEKAKSVVVTLNDNRRLAATQILVFDPNLDLALLRLPPGQYPKVTLAQANPKVGANVYAIGNPSGLSNTLSKGLVSGIRATTAGQAVRTGEVDGQDASQAKRINNFMIQHTAAISGGSSGGVLLAETGEVIGVNTLSATAVQGANFAVPAADVAAMIANAGSKTGKTLEQGNVSSGADKRLLDLASLPPATAKRLEAAAKNYAYIGTTVCNVQLYERYEELKKSNPTDERSISELAFLSDRSTPLIVSADGKRSWHSLAEALGEMKVRAGTARVLKVADRDLLILSEGVIFILQNCPEKVSEGDTIRFFCTVAGSTTFNVEGRPQKVPILNWNPGAATLSPELLGTVLMRDNVKSLLTVSTTFSASGRAIVGYETQRNGNVIVKRPIYGNKASWKRNVTTEAIRLGGTTENSSDKGTAQTPSQPAKSPMWSSDGKSSGNPSLTDIPGGLR